MQQTGNQNTQTLQAKVVILIYPQILIFTNLLQGNLQQVKRRVNSHILGLCGLRVSDKFFYRGMEACLSCKFILFQSDI